MFLGPLNDSYTQELLVQLENQQSGNNPVGLYFMKNPAGDEGASGDQIVDMMFWAKNDAEQVEELGRINVTMSDATDGDEQMKYSFTAKDGGALKTPLTLQGANAVFAGNVSPSVDNDKSLGSDGKMWDAVWTNEIYTTSNGTLYLVMIIICRKRQIL